MALYLGCGEWALKGWMGGFFPSGTPQRNFLHAYSRRLSMVEGNTSFYGVPSRDSILRWRDETPPGFHFCFKFPRTISHDKLLLDCAEETEEWLSLLRLMGDRAGPSYLQLSKGFGPNRYKSLERYLTALPRDLLFAVEVRHPGWFYAPARDRLDSLLKDLGIARVIYDIRGLRSSGKGERDIRKVLGPKPNVPTHIIRTAPFTLIRFISHPEVPANAGLLDQWAERIARWLAKGDGVYFAMHNKDDITAPALCCDLHRRVSKYLPLPPLPKWIDPPGPSQLSLFD